MKRIFFIGIFAIATITSSAAADEDPPIDTASNAHWRMLAEAALSKASSISGSDSSALFRRIKLAKEALSYATKASDSFNIAMSYQELGYNYTALWNHTEAIKALDLSIAYFSKEYSPQQQDSYYLKIDDYFITGDYDAAIRTGLQAVETIEQHHNTTVMPYLYNMMSLTYLNARDYNNAIKYGQKGILIAEQEKDTNYVYLCAGKIATALARMGRTNEGITVLQNAQKKFPSRLPGRLTICYYRYLNIYLDEGRPDLAEPYARFLIRQYKTRPDENELYKEWYLGVSRFYLASKEYEKALQFLARYEPPQKKLEVNAVLQMYQFKYQADSALGRFQDTLDDHIRFKTFSDSLFNERKSRLIARLNIDFETERRDRRLTLQQERLELQQASLGRSQALRNLLIYSIAGLLLITGLVISRYQLKTTKNKELTRQKETIDKKNAKLQQLVQEKEHLLKEVHHRVKNNLQIILSLLNSQGMHAKEDAVFEAIRDSQARVYSMAMIHQKLYTSSNVLSVDLQDYITDLVNYFRSGFTGSISSSPNNNAASSYAFFPAQRTEFRLELSPVTADVSVAVPLALILNEAITNSLKHAFPSGKAGLIRIWLTSKGNGEAEMGISDNGIGLLPHFDLQRQSSLGLNLIRGLTEDLGGQFLIDGNNGVEIRIFFSSENIKEGIPA